MARRRGIALAALLGWAGICSALVVPLPAARPAVSLAQVSLPRATDGEKVELGAAMAPSSGKTMLVLGTYPGDFNMVEYAQKIRAFWPALQEKGVSRCMVVVNGERDSCLKLAELLDLPAEIELLADPTGEAGRSFGVSRGFRPDDAGLSPALKLFFMGIGLGTLPPTRTHAPTHAHTHAHIHPRTHPHMLAADTAHYMYICRYFHVKMRMYVCMYVCIVCM